MNFSKSFKVLEKILERRFLNYDESYFSEDFFIIDSRDNMSFIKELVPDLKATAEIGVQWGVFSKRIVTVLKPKRHYCIDYWKYIDSGYERDTGNVSDKEHELRYMATVDLLKEEIGSGVVKIIRDLSSNALRKLPPASLDFIYIDGNHNYEAVLEDLYNSIRVIKKGGIIGGHDFLRQGVNKAVAEVCKKTDLKLVAHGISCTSFYLREEPF